MVKVTLKSDAQNLDEVIVVAYGTAKKSSAEIAKEIYNGTCSDARWSSWGNGADRVNRLKQAGYDPSEVQSEVNKLF